MSSRETRSGSHREQATSDAAAAEAAVATESRGLDAPTAVRGLEQRRIAGGTELWVKPLGVGLGQWSLRPAVRLVLLFVTLSAAGAVARPFHAHLASVIALPLHLLLLWAAFDLLARLKPRRIAVQSPGRLKWSKGGTEIALPTEDVVAIEVTPAPWRPWRVTLQAVRTDAGRSDLVPGMWPSVAAHTAQALREALASVPVSPPLRPGQGLLGQASAADPDALAEVGDPELEEVAAVVPLPPGLTLDQADGWVELGLSRQRAFLAGWRGTAFLPIVASVLGAGIAALLLRHLPPELWGTLLTSGLPELVGGLVQIVFWVQLVRLLLMALPSTRVRIGRHSIEVVHRDLRRKLTLTPVADAAGVRAERSSGSWAVVMQLHDGRARIVASRLHSEAMAHALALWLRVGISRARGAQAPATQPPSSSSP